MCCVNSSDAALSCTYFINVQKYTIYLGIYTEQNYKRNIWKIQIIPESSSKMSPIMVSVRAVGVRCNAHFYTISRLWRRFQQFGATVNRPHARRPRVTTPVQDRYMTDILALSMPMARSCDICGISTSDKSWHFGVAFYCPQNKECLYNGHALLITPVHATPVWLEQCLLQGVPQLWKCVNKFTHKVAQKWNCPVENDLDRWVISSPRSFIQFTKQVAQKWNCPV